MRILSIVVAGALLAGPAAADVIYLKNGRAITAENVREEGGRVVYELGEGTFAIPRSSVERIDTAAARSAPAEPLPAITPAQVFSGRDELLAAVLRQGEVDEMALTRLESSASGETAAAAYFLAARYELERSRLEAGRRLLERSIDLLPEHGLLRQHLAALLLRMGRATQALPHALRATEYAPYSHHAFALLGYSYLHAGRLREALAALERSVELGGDDETRQARDRVRRELKAEADFVEDGSAHFLLRYEGARGGARLPREVLQALEFHYARISNLLGVAPRERLVVVLYTERAFFDVTQAPAWSGAVNDGRLRIPVEGLDAMTPELSRVLAHELAHSFVTYLAGRRSPQWLDEGVAQLLEPKTTQRHGARLHTLYGDRRQMPLRQLEASFNSFPEAQAQIAYAQSLAAVEYLVEHHGMETVVRLLRRIGEGASAAEALQALTGAGYERLEQQIGFHLARKYGN